MKKTDKTMPPTQPFVLATDFAEDGYAQEVVRRTRYQWAFFAALGLVGMMAIGLWGVLPLKQYVPILIEHYPSGIVKAQIASPGVPALDPAAMKHELVHYVELRENRTADGLDFQNDQVALFSSDGVYRAYRKEIRTFFNTYPDATAKVHIESVVVVADQDTDTPLVEITFTQHITTGGKLHHAYKTALVRFEHRGIGTDPNVVWHNWDGLRITRYDVTSRAIESIEGELL